MIETILNSSATLKPLMGSLTKRYKLSKHAPKSYLTNKLSFGFAYTSHSIEPLIQPYTYMRKDIFQKQHNVKNNNPWEGWFNAEGSRNFFKGELLHIFRKQLKRINIPVLKSSSNNTKTQSNNNI